MWLINITSFDGIRHVVKIEPTPNGLLVYDTLIPWRELVSQINDSVGLDCILDVAREIQDEEAETEVAI